jgi:PleD family two-component response regulator
MPKSPSSYTGTNGNVSKARLGVKDVKINNKSTNAKNRIGVMVVDNDFDICNLTRMVLQKQGFDVYGFTDPLLALEHFRTNCESCNIVMDGFEFLQNIAKTQTIKSYST